MLGSEIPEGTSANDEFYPGQSAGDGMEVGVFYGNDQLNRGSVTGDFIDEFQHGSDQFLPDEREELPVTRQLLVLRRLAKERRFKELAELKNNIDNT